MSTASGKLFDNVGVRSRGSACAVFSVQPPFMLACWPELRAVLSALGLHEVCLHRPADQARFLTALADRSDGAADFRPALVGFRLSRKAIRQREAFRHNYRGVVFLGKCSRQMALAALDLASTQVQAGGTIDIKAKGWDFLADWSCGSQRLKDWCNYLAHTIRRRGTVTVFSEFRELAEDLWRLVYDCPNVRLAWQADTLARLSDMTSFQAYWEASPAARNLQDLAETGVRPHIVLPVTRANTAILPDLVAAILNQSRGASLELTPLPLLSASAPDGSGPTQLPAPLPADNRGSPVLTEYVKSLLTACSDVRIPRELVAPLSWVASRLDRQLPMVSSPLAAGAELAMLANGDIYPGEYTAGIERWRLGNVLDDPATLRWERLDALPEVFSPANMPPQCRACDWRYRCGGADPSVSLLHERFACPAATPTGVADPCQSGALFDLYCAPRKALFEEMLWSSVGAGLAGKHRSGRELLELHTDGIIFRREECP